MKLKDGDPLDIEGEDGEEIVFEMTDGTVLQVITILDGVKQILKKGEEKKFKLQKGQRRRLLATYIFKATSDEFYETHVTGSAGGDESVDKFKQIPQMADHERRYDFEVP